MTKAMCVFISESCHFTPKEILHFYGEKHKVMAKASDNPFCFEIPCINEDLDTVPFSKIRIANSLKESMHNKMKR
ncbi:MAG: hypothetical protein ACD_17C00109G0002 [uncultured bacterium]|nr:MAG: hypothetical protein ACD_17C00109G0002 [uncultured bacterium]